MIYALIVVNQKNYTQLEQMRKFYLEI